MKKTSWIVAVLLVFALTANLFAAPLFPDVPAEHWARDAVAELANKGIVEGYPDGTFKGDRAATRWELAMVVARFLSKMEAEHATFATKEDLETVKKLVDTLKEELDALGVRVTNLEDNLAKLDKRVWALEKITFYGEVDARLVTNGVINNGASQWTLGGVQVTDYNSSVGFSNGVSLGNNATFGQQWGSPFVYGGGATINSYTTPLNWKVGVIDYFNGMPLINGAGYTGKGILGTKIRVSEDVSAGAEFSAYCSTGDPMIDAWWGVQQPYLSNPFAGSMFNQNGVGAQQVQGQTNMPFTRMTLDNFWFTHNPSGSKLIVGSYQDNNMDDIIMFGTPNPNRLQGPSVLPNYGFNFTGKTHLFTDLNYELMMFLPPDAQPGVAANSESKNGALAFNLDWLFDRGNFKLNYMNVSNSFWAGNPPNNIIGALPAANYNHFFWVNPDATTAAQANVNQAIPGGGVGGFGNLGPQNMNSYGAAFKYNFQNKWYVDLHWGSTNYKPNMASSYSVSGSAFSFVVGTTLAQDLLDLNLGYFTTDPTYDPMVFSTNYSNALNTNAAVNRLYSFQRYPHWTFDPYLYQLHDSDNYTNNRRGLKFGAEYRFKDKNGKINFKYASLEQVESSLSNVYYGAGSAGFKPGWIDPFFSPLAKTAGNVAFEDVRGKETNWGLGVKYTFTNKLGVDINYDSWKYERKSGLGAGGFGAGTLWTNGMPYNTNHIDMNINELNIGVNYPFNEKFKMFLGYDTIQLSGSYASPGTNVSTTQGKPYIGFDYKISDNTSWDFCLSGYSVNDGVNNDPSNTVAGTTGNLNWSGIQLNTGVKVTF